MTNRLHPFAPSEVAGRDPVLRHARHERALAARTQIAVACAVAAVYLLFPNRFYTFDALSYAADVREASLLFHPHHLLYSAFCWVSWQAVSFLAPIEPLSVMAVWSALTTAGAVLLVGSILRKLEVPASLALGASLFFAFAYGPWFTGTTAEVYGFTLLLEAATFRMLLEATPERRAPVLFGAAMCGLAMLFHQTSIFLVPAAAWLAARRTRSWRTGLAFALAALAIAGTTYVAVGLAEGRHSVTSLSRWILHYTRGSAYESGRWGRVSWQNVPQAFAGIAGTFLFPRTAAELFAGAPLVMSASVVALGVSALALVGAMVLLVSRRVRAGRGTEAIERDATRALWIWLALRALFSLWWEPANLEWWLLVALPGSMCLGVWLANGADRGRRTAPVLLAAVAIVATSNFALRVWPDSRLERNEPYATLAALRRQGLGPHDLVVGDRVELIPYARYFAHFTLRMETLTGETYGGAADREAAIARFRERIVAARRRGRVWVLESELDPSRDILMLYPQWRREDYERCYAPLKSRLVPRARFVAQGREGRIFALR